MARSESPDRLADHRRAGRVVVGGQGRDVRADQLPSVSNRARKRTAGMGAGGTAFQRIIVYRGAQRVLLNQVRNVVMAREQMRRHKFNNQMQTDWTSATLQQYITA